MTTGEPRKINMGEAIEIAFRVLHENERAREVIRAGGAEPISDDDLLADFPEMSPAEADYLDWAMSGTVDTGGRCNCGHEGIGVDWHTVDCPGANYALIQKVRELMRTLDTLRGVGRPSVGTAP